MTLAKKRRPTTESQKPTLLLMRLKQIENERRKAEKNKRMFEAKANEDIERVIEAKVAMALRLIKT